MKERAELRLPLFVPGDAPLPDDAGYLPSEGPLSFTGRENGLSVAAVVQEERGTGNLRLYGKPKGEESKTARRRRAA